MTDQPSSPFDILQQQVEKQNLSLDTDWCGFDEIYPYLEMMTLDGWVTCLTCDPLTNEPAYTFNLSPGSAGTEPMTGYAEERDSMLAQVVAAYLVTLPANHAVPTTQPWDPQPTELQARAMMTLAQIQGIPMSMYWHGVNDLWPLIEAVRDDGCSLFLKFDGQRNRNQMTLLIYGGALGDVRLRRDGDNLLDTLVQLMLDYAGVVPPRYRTNPSY
ncbi:hypothetical protein [Acanthopleuribacter pedis]|uniref:Uncharacterized protein n=1 Tax=Acanthopleuribacter pedis TaxID=442870 RepID=A0A8J7Q470_9BACT|nr:hypothetical protein [Acanthopleuribacter pedis]MBO1317386.1 hypothetical protein [Acanthopleuribacter pedis]